MRRFSFGYVVAAAALLLTASCAEQAGTGETIPIPTVSISCDTAQCRANSATRVIYVTITSSGCDPEFSVYGTVATSSSVSISCNGVTGCSGQMSSWIGKDQQPATTIASGTYSVCGRIDHNGDFSSGTTNNDTVSVLNDKSLTKTTGPITLTTWAP